MEELTITLNNPTYKGIELSYDIEVEAIYKIMPAEKGLRSEFGLQVTPDYPESAKLIKVIYSGLNIYQQLSDYDIKFIMTKILSHLEYK